MRAWFAEPLVQFALGGAVIAALYQLLAPAEEAAGQRIEVRASVVSELVAEREAVLGRTLDAEEVAAVRAGYVDQEVLVREAFARGLHLHDGRVRHRLADKMLFLIAEEPAAPTEQDLRSFLEQNRERYRIPERVSFEHRFFGEDRPAAEAALVSGGEGEAFWLGPSFEETAAHQLLPAFGPAFTIAIIDAPRGEWSGPIESSQGWHLVRLIARHPPEDPPYELIADRLAVDWLVETRAALRRAELERLRQRYLIVDVQDAP